MSSSATIRHTMFCPFCGVLFLLRESPAMHCESCCVMATWHTTRFSREHKCNVTTRGQPGARVCTVLTGSCFLSVESCLTFFQRCYVSFFTVCVRACVYCQRGSFDLNGPDLRHLDLSFPLSHMHAHTHTRTSSPLSLKSIQQH